MRTFLFAPLAFLALLLFPAVAALEEIESWSTSWPALRSGEELKVDYPALRVPLTSFSGTLTRDVAGARLTTVLRELDTPNSKVFARFALVPSSLGDADVDVVKISFYVPDTWLSARGVSQGAVSLYYLDVSGWRKAPTAAGIASGSRLGFLAAVPGFGEFAIGLEAPSSIPAAVTPASSTGAVSASPASSWWGSPTGILVIVLVVVVLLINVAFLFIRGRAEEHHRLPGELSGEAGPDAQPADPSDSTGLPDPNLALLKPIEEQEAIKASLRAKEAESFPLQGLVEDVEKDDGPPRL